MADQTPEQRAQEQAQGCVGQPTDTDDHTMTAQLPNMPVAGALKDPSKDETKFLIQLERRKYGGQPPAA